MDTKDTETEPRGVLDRHCRPIILRQVLIVNVGSALAAVLLYSACTPSHGKKTLVSWEVPLTMFQCVSESVFQCFSISVFTGVNVSEFQCFRISVFKCFSA